MDSDRRQPFAGGRLFRLNATYNARLTIAGGSTYSVTLTGILPASGVDVRATGRRHGRVTGKVTASGHGCLAGCSGGTQRVPTAR